MSNLSPLTAGSPLLAWTSEQARGFGSAVHVGHHAVSAREDLVGDAALAGLLDRLPAEATHVYTMGTDPADRSEWRQGSTGDLTGAALLDAVRRGRIWLNLLRVQDHDPAWASALADVVQGLRTSVPGLQVVRSSVTVIVSSPTSLVHYHADAQPNLLLHCRGRKRVVVWPALDPRCVTQADLQKIFTGEATEQLPYPADGDRHATVVELEPGHVISWPQNAGHRVSNTDGLNVSMSVEYATPASLRRERVWGANRLLSRRLHLPSRGTREVGVVAAAKAASFRVLRRLSTPVGYGHQTSFLVDPSAPLCVRGLETGGH